VGQKFPEVSVVVPTYNRKKDVLDCLGSLQNLTYPHCEVIVVDNGSTDGTAEAVKQRFPTVKLVRSDKNLGAAGGRNLGAKHSMGEYIFFLDSDTVVDRNVLSELVHVMQSDPGIGVAGPILYYYDNPDDVWTAGSSVSFITGQNYFNQQSVGNNVIETQILPTAFMVKKCHNFGLFDDVFFFLYEDSDFCVRVREAGCKVVCVPTAKVWHKLPSDKRESTEKWLQRGYYVARNKIIFMRKHTDPLYFIVFLSIYPAYAIYYTMISLRFRRADCLLRFWAGIFSGLSFAMRYKRSTSTSSPDSYQVH
jgi:hypothetical protein